MATEKAERVAIGFDLGTTYSCVAFCKNAKSEVVSNSEGKKTTASVVAYIGNDKIVGSQALNQMESSPQNVIYDSKRMMGKKYNDKTLQEDMKKWPFKLEKSKRGLPVIVCDNKQISPEEIGASILSELKSFAEGYLETTITDCVITCPASFNDAEREATMNAARIAGLNCIRLINEPTAASVAYGVSKECEGRVLIYDLGGGTFDATILSIKNGVFEVEVTGGDPHLGGKDLDNKVVDHIMQKFNSNRTTNRIDINDVEYRESKKKLSKAVEDAKIALTNQTSTNIFIPSFCKTQQTGKYIDLKMALSRTALEKQARPLVEKTINITTNLLKENNIDESKLEKVVCVGGFTKMPFVREQLKKQFGERVSFGVNPDEAVALGAAMMAEVFMTQGKDQTNVKGLPKLLLDVTPLGLGIELENGVMSRIIQPNTPIPTVMEEKYTTSSNDQTSVAIVVFQGNREFVKDNKKLGFFKLEGIPCLPKGKADIIVKFQISEDGVLDVTATEKSSGAIEDLRISKDKVGSLTEEEVEKMIKDAQDFAEVDKKKKEAMLEKEELERALAEYEEIGVTNPGVAALLLETSDWLEEERLVEELSSKRLFLIEQVQKLQE